jgi:dTDP-4-dehydrorhamnose 3,5-epimerase-like enzyme
MALYVPNMLWRSLDNFSTNALCLVLTSGSYDEDDYIRNYKDFKKILGTENSESSKISSLYDAINRQPQFNTVFDCSLIELPVIKNRAGNITSVHGGETIPFDIKRVFYIYDIPSGAKRGMHAHKHCHEILIAAGGSFEVELNDGLNKKTILLNRPTYGLHIPPGVWATEKEYSSGVVCLALASDVYDSDDYINTYADFKKYRQNGDKNI